MDAEHLHHAYLLEGDRESVRSDLFDFIEQELEEALHGNPDFWHGQFEQFTIDDARELRERQSNKAFSDARKIFILEAALMTHEAQNALLKMLEEPTPNTHFFLIMPSREVLLPTVRSRLMISALSRDKEVGKNKESLSASLAKTFLQAEPAERLKLVAPIVEEKDRIQAQQLVDHLIKELRRRSSIGNSANTSNSNLKSDTFETLLRYRGFLNDRSPSIKLILEDLALIL